MKNVDEKVEMLGIFEQSDAEKPVVINIERLNHPLFFRFDISDMLYFQTESLAVIDGLHGVALLVQFDACE